MKDAHFLSYDAQIAHLREKGLMIRDETYARDVLEAIGYYELINGYKRLFKDTNNGPFRTGVCFEDILALYKCDENL
ncbi:MAG: Abi family protein, partial [Clostridia bacterium]|nr:Abi family protein [Clostridia bacterium]